MRGSSPSSRVAWRGEAVFGFGRLHRGLLDLSGGSGGSGFLRRIASLVSTCCNLPHSTSTDGSYVARRARSPWPGPRPGSMLDAECIAMEYSGVFWQVLKFVRPVSVLYSVLHRSVLLGLDIVMNDCTYIHCHACMAVEINVLTCYAVLRSGVCCNSGCNSGWTYMP